MCLVLFGAVRQTELYLTSSVQFGQNSKTPLRSVTSWVGSENGHIRLLSVHKEREGGSEKVQKPAYVIYEWSLTSLNFEKSIVMRPLIDTLVISISQHDIDIVYFCKNCTNIERTNLN